MERINYSFVDVFSNGKYTGNQLAVFKKLEVFQVMKSNK